MTKPNTLLLRANALIRRSRPLEETDWEYTIRERTVAYHLMPGRNLKLILIFFRSSGCRYDRRGECTMCNYGSAGHVDADRMVAIVQKALQESAHYESLGISPSGNMFDAIEVPADARRRIFELAAATDCEVFSSESRPEFFSEEALVEFEEILQDKRRLINVGLETTDPWIQRNCVGKSLTLEAFQHSMALLARHGVGTIANVLLGIPFLTEQESLETAIRSLRGAIDNGVQFCVLFPSNVKKWTLQHWLWERGLYRTPSLWTLIEALYALGPDLAQRVALSWYSAPVSDFIPEVPHTCGLCQSSVMARLDRYNATLDFGEIEELRRSACTCRTRWQVRMAEPLAVPRLDRVASQYQRIGYELLGSSWWEANKEQVWQQLESGYRYELSGRQLG